MRRFSCWSEVYEHDTFGKIELTWHGEEPTRSHLIAMQSELWTPTEEVEDCLRWARNLQENGVTRAGDGGTSEQTE